jgi:plastocyanin
MSWACRCRSRSAFVSCKRLRHRSNPRPSARAFSNIRRCSCGYQVCCPAGPMKTFKVLLVLTTTCITTACSSNTPSAPAPASPGPDVTINITGINGAQSFAPSPTTVNVGQRVIWKNTDTRSHDAVQDTNAFSTPVLASGASSDPVMMNTRGTFTYHCTIHPSMVGTLTVQ